jgi:hypothetical protein
MAFDTDRRLPRLWPYLLLCAGLAAWIDFSSFHRHNHSDSLVPVLSSLYAWTPFYWEQNRVGMLVPFLAVPFRHPMDNLLFEAWLVLWAALALPFLLARYVLRAPGWPLAALVAAAAWVGLSSPGWLFNSSFGQLHYAPSLCLGVGGLLVVEAAAACCNASAAVRRLLAALVLLLLANWANSAVSPFLLPLVLLRALFGSPVANEAEPTARWRRVFRALNGEAILALALAGIGFASCFGHVWLVPVKGNPVECGLQPPRYWLQSWGRMATNTWREACQDGWRGLLGLALAGGLWYVLPRLRSQTKVIRRNAAGLLAAAAVYGLFMGSAGWVRVNNFSARYWIPVVFIGELALAILAVAPLLAAARPRLAAVATTGLALIVASTFGLPSRTQARAALDEITVAGVTLAERTADIVATRATHLAGDYWQVWTSVFHANLVLRERHQDHLVWGLSHRSSPTWPSWGLVEPDALRLAILTPQGRPPQDIQPLVENYFGPLEVAERRPTLWRMQRRHCNDSHSPSDDQPVQTLWYGGFFPPWDYQLSSLHLCGGTGSLRITNRSGSPRTVTLEMGLHAIEREPCHLWLDSDLFTDCVPLSWLPRAYTRTITVPPGRHAVTYYCDGRIGHTYRHPRPVVFCVSDFHLVVEPAEGPPTAGLLPAQPAVASGRSLAP